MAFLRAYKGNTPFDAAVLECQNAVTKANKKVATLKKQIATAAARVAKVNPPANSTLRKRLVVPRAAGWNKASRSRRRTPSTISPTSRSSRPWRTTRSTSPAPIGTALAVYRRVISDHLPVIVNVSVSMASCPTCSRNCDVPSRRVRTTGTFEVAGIQSGAYTALFTRLGLPAVLPLTSALGWTHRRRGRRRGRGADRHRHRGTARRARRAGRVPFHAGRPGFTLKLLDPDPAGRLGVRNQLRAARWQGLRRPCAVFDPAAHPRPGRASALIVASGPAADPLRTVDEPRRRSRPAPQLLRAVRSGVHGARRDQPRSWTAARRRTVASARSVYAAATGAVQLDLVLAKTSVSGLFGSLQGLPASTSTWRCPASLDPAGARAI